MENISVREYSKDIEEVYNTRIMAEKYREIYEEALEQAATEKDRKKKK